MQIRKLAAELPLPVAGMGRLIDTDQSVASWTYSFHWTERVVETHLGNDIAIAANLLCDHKISILGRQNMLTPKAAYRKRIK